jgi:energy-converting hydrogenase Eha subunit B
LGQRRPSDRPSKFGTSDSFTILAIVECTDVVLRAATSTVISIRVAVATKYSVKLPVAAVFLLGWLRRRNRF